MQINMKSDMINSQPCMCCELQQFYSAGTLPIAVVLTCRTAALDSTVKKNGKSDFFFQLCRCVHDFIAYNV